MADQSQVYRPTDQPVGASPSAMELLDPVALEARLVEARARRAEAIARRQAAKDGREPGPGAEPAPFRRPEPAQMPRPAAAPTPVAPATALRPVEWAAPARAVLTPEFAEAPAPAPAHPTRNRLPTSFVPTPPVVPPPLVAEGRLPARRRRGLRDYPAFLAAMFVTGLIGGGTLALVAPAFLRERLAQIVVPVSPVPPETAVAAAPPVLADTALAPPDARAPSLVPESPALPAPAPAGAPSAQAPDPPMGPNVESAAGAPAGAAPVPPSVGALPDQTLRDLRTAERRAGLDPAPAVTAVRSAPDAPPPPGAAMEPQVAALRAPLVSVPPPVEIVTAPHPVAEAPVAADARVLVHYPPTSAEAARVAVQALQAAGVPQASAVPAGLSVSATNIRYYHPEDREAARAIAELLAPAAGEVAPEARDFTDFRPQPAAGVIEVWLSGRAAAVAQRATAARAVSAAPASRAAPAASASTGDAEEIQRLLQQRAVERMLRAQLQRN